MTRLFPTLPRHSRARAAWRVGVPVFLTILVLFMAAPDVVLAASDAEEGHSSWMPTIAKMFNFAVLAGILVYFLRAPIAGYLRSRSETIRKGLVEAASLRSSAEAQLTTVRTQLAKLPAELEALKRRGQEELAAEGVRMKEATARERESAAGADAARYRSAVPARAARAAGAHGRALDLARAQARRTDDHAATITAG